MFQHYVGLKKIRLTYNKTEDMDDWGTDLRLFGFRYSHYGFYKDFDVDWIEKTSKNKQELEIYLKSKKYNL
jgi:outer membrane usher protein FimD/PapC